MDNRSTTRSIYLAKEQKTLTFQSDIVISLNHCIIRNSSKKEPPLRQQGRLTRLRGTTSVARQLYHCGRLFSRAVFLYPKFKKEAILCQER